MVGTPFRGTKLPLDSLFYIVNQFSNTSQSINSKRFMDALGTGYKTGLSYGHKLRELMPQGTIEGFSGEGCIIEMDETWIGGVNKRGGIKSKSDDRICVFGMRNRETGLVKAFVIKAASRENIIPIILREIKPGTEIHTDESAIYKAPIISKLYKHKFITHKRHKDINGNLMQRRFRVDNVTTNGMESFWSLLKRTLSGVHISVSEKHLQLYVDERVFRQNWKKRRELIFDELLSRIRASSGAPL
ncbi:MAG: IS1595 family transposase [Bacteroidia bacterium]